MSKLIEVSTEAVKLFQSDASQFTQEVIGCMNHAFHLKLSCGKGKDSHSDYSSNDQVSCNYSEYILYVHAVYCAGTVAAVHMQSNPFAMS